MIFRNCICKLYVINSWGQTLSFKKKFDFKNGSYTASGNCGASLAANAECNVIIEFKPTANATSSKTLKVNYKSGNTSAVKFTQIILTGRGAGAQKAFYTDLIKENTGPLSKCACMRIVAKDANILSALNLAHIPIGSAFSAAHIESAYSRFYPGGVISADTRDKLMGIGNKATLPATVLIEATSNDKKNFEGWRYIFMTLCLSSGWQAP